MNRGFCILLLSTCLFGSRQAFTFAGTIIHDWAHEGNDETGITAGAGVPITHFVSHAGLHVSPFTNWVEAATNIQSAIDVAQYGDLVLVTDGTYTVSSAITLTNGITVASLNGRETVVVDGENNSRCFYMNHIDSKVNRITITRGYADQGGAILCSNGVVQDCLVSYSRAEGYSALGGGIYCGPGGMVSNCLIVHNSATGRDEWGSEIGGAGGGVFSAGGRLVSCTLASNRCASSGQGGGVSCWLNSSVRGCTITDNLADIGGGVACGQTSVVSQCVIRDNRAGSWFGGGAFCVGDGKIEESQITRNSSGLLGGGVFCVGGSVNACDIRENRAMEGAGVYLLGMPYLPDFDFTPIAGNSPSTVENCIVSRNIAWTNGGGISCSSGSVQNCTIAGNVASNYGGGVYCSSNATVRNTIVYGNMAPSGFNVATGGAGNVFSYSCVSPLFPGTGNITNDPQLTPSYRLKGTSPCIDAGSDSNATPTDIDGEARWDHPGHSNVASIVDIGADEFVDTDLDNMADFWETEAFGSVTNRDGTADTDDDALNDLAEYEHSTTPTKSDTDADEMPDGWEVSHTLNPLADDAQGDPDSDGMRNVGEYVSDTDPHDANSVLSLIRVDPQFGGIRLDWKGGREAWQILECRENLASTTEQWTAIFALPPPTALTNAIIDMGATSPATFYRIRAERW